MWDGWSGNIAKVACDIWDKKVHRSSNRANAGEIAVVDGILFEHYQFSCLVGRIYCVDDDLADDLTCPGFNLTSDKNLTGKIRLAMLSSNKPLIDHKKSLWSKPLLKLLEYPWQRSFQCFEGCSPVWCWGNRFELIVNRFAVHPEIKIKINIGFYAHIIKQKF